LIFLVQNINVIFDKKKFARVFWVKYVF